MAQRVWTEEQSAAIATRDRTLLVSAAAGSGKTATLTERIIRSLLDEKNPINISDMLIVTFTNAAVDELRERIAKAVKSAAEENPSDIRLQKQLLSMKDAKIMTIDSFCNRIVKLSPEAVGLPPNYRIGEGAEMALLRSELLEGMIFSAYEGELEGVCTAEEFSALAECLTDTRSEGEIGEIFRMLYEKSESSEYGVEIYRTLADKFDPQRYTCPEESEFGKYIVDKTRLAAQGYYELYRMSDSLATGSKVEQKAHEIYTAEAAMLKRIADADTYGKIKKILDGYVFPSLPGGKGERGPIFCDLKEIRALLKDELAKFADKYFSYTPEDFAPLFAELYEKTSVLYRFLAHFDTLYSKEKKKRGVCTYADLERYAVSLLYNDGEPSPLALEVASSYKQIYIDEYQDVNKLQGMIFDAVARSDNRFMVGDIKQSIYGFRAARPEIFAGMKKSFPQLNTEGDRPAASLFMSSNFRCDKPIIDFTNEIFDKMFSAFAKNIGYTEADKLVFAKKYEKTDTPSGIVPEIHIVARSAQVYLGDEEQDPSGEREAAAVAERIGELIRCGKKNDGSPITPKDIAIIIRSDSGRAKTYADALDKLNIKASIPDSRDFFLNEEILLTLSLLHSVDNPRKDIYLSSLMCSPLFGFSADELLFIRRGSKSETLWEALLEYTGKNHDFEKGKRFIEKLSEYRDMAEGVSVDRLLSILYRETGLMALAAKSGRKDNLILLHNYARQYEDTSFKGLYSFISYINQIIENGEKAQFAEISGERDSVKVLTAHKSKGLEFPVCFFVGTGSGLTKGNRSRIALNSDFGISILLKDKTGLATVENPIFHAIESYTDDESFEEELRVLYVALTRARERLFIYGTVQSQKCDGALEKANVKRQYFSAFLARKCKSFLDIILTTHLTGKLFTHEAPEGEVAEQQTKSTDVEEKEKVIAPEAEEPSLSAAELARARDVLDSRFAFSYPHIAEGLIPEKLSVSKLYPAILDEGLEETERFSIEGDVPLDFRPTIPEFILGRPADESAKKGIATHMFMQFCDLDRLEMNGAEEELSRLVGLEFLSKKEGARVRISEIDKFTRSPLFAEMKSAKHLYRELRFNLRLPAEEFTETPEIKQALVGKTILTQGVIDCLIEAEDGSLHLIDYKTDRLTKDELEDKSLACEKLRVAHSRQLSYYKRAVLEMFGKEPRRTGVYSLHLGEEIDL